MPRSRRPRASAMMPDFLPYRSTCRRARATISSSSRRTSRCCSACESTQSRIICCSVRMWWTRPWIASARLAMALVAALLEPHVGRSPRAAARSQPASRRRRCRPSARARWRRSLVSPMSCTVVASQSSSSVWKRFCAWLICRSRKPSTSEPASPNSEDENEMPMPLSGAASPSRSVSNVALASPPTFRLLITPPTEVTVSIRPQKVPSRPRKISSPVM